LQLNSIRAKFLLVAAIGLSLFVTTADLPIKFLYDQRYQAASWMLPVLIMGSWFSILAVINESTLLGLGKPSYSAISNGFKFAFIFIGMPLGIKLYGLLGGVIAIALADLFRYIPIFVGQKRERFSFGMQDVFLTLTLILLIIFLEWLRWFLGFGTSFDSLPIYADAVSR
jgi:O-antigen/teichoic acid export membrane protein